MQITNLSRKGIIDRCNELIAQKGCKNIVTLNSLMVKRSWHNFELSKAIRNASLITADSVGICLASRMLDGKKVFRYPGIEMMEDLIKQNWKVFLLGGRPGITQKASQNISRRYPHARLCGTHHGYFKTGEEKKVVTRINTLSPDVVFVGLDIPRQEIWIDKNKKKINAGLLVGVGGSFDVAGGSLPRSPYIFRVIGIEWLWRTAVQPWRIVRIINLPVFLMEAVWRFLKGKPLLD